MGKITKKIISDQVLYRLAGGVPDSSFPVDELDVWRALDQKINSIFKLRHFDVTLPSGETQPEYAMIATFEDITVVKSNEKSYALLSTQPISLPKGMGILLVYDPNYPDMPFIPIQKGQTALLRTDTLLSDIMGQISYEPKNDRIIFNKDITTLGIETVSMDLCVFDIEQYSITEYLPVPSDYEERLVAELVAEFAPVMAENGYVNNFTNAGQQPDKK